MLSVHIAKTLNNFSLDVAFDADSKGITALFGRSGSGKSTLVNLIAGLLPPDSGHVTVNGEVLFNTAKGIDLPPEKRRIGYVFQESRLFPHMTVTSNLTYGMNLTPSGNVLSSSIISSLCWASTICWIAAPAVYREGNGSGSPLAGPCSQAHACY